MLVGRRQGPDTERDGTFGDVEAEFEEFPMNWWCIPGRILCCHPFDQSA